MTRTFMIALVAATGLSACAQTADVPGPQTAVLKSDVSDVVSTESAQDGEAVKTVEVIESGQDQEYWLKNGLASLYDGEGQWLQAFQDKGPYKIYGANGDKVKISDAEDHWVRRIDLSKEPPKMRPTLNTSGPARPITTFPNILEQEAKRRGAEMKKDNP